MENWVVSYKKGKYYLNRHNPDMALRYFKTALNACPLRDQKSHSKILFYAGITLKKLGFGNTALKSWILAIKFEKLGYAYRMVRRFSNQYGMVKQSSPWLDDWEAFFSIQFSKYLQYKHNQKIGSSAELDMVRDLILGTWQELEKDTNFSAALKRSETAEEKISLFREIRIIFPLPVSKRTYSEAEVDDSAGIPIPYNFRLHRVQTNEMRCFCGSNLPYQLCCGRITSGEELINGCF